MTATALPAPAARLARATIGRKILMAATGLVLFAFVLGHLSGNLLVYLGPEALNGYAAFLRRFLHGAGLWLARAALLGSVVVHAWCAWSLTRASRAARPVDYHRLETPDSTYASRTMRWGGVIIALFVVYHLMHFTFGNAHPDFRHGDVYRNFVIGFQSLPVCLVYGVAVIAVGLHIRHGAWSMLRTLGLSHPRYMKLARAAAAAVALLVTLGNLSFPVAVQIGLVR